MFIKYWFNKDWIIGLTRWIINSGIESKIPNNNDVDNLGRALVNLENMHLTHIGELPEPWLKLKMTQNTTNDEVKAF